MTANTPIAMIVLQRLHRFIVRDCMDLLSSSVVSTAAPRLWFHGTGFNHCLYGWFAIPTTETCRSGSASLSGCSTSTAMQRPSSLCRRKSSSVIARCTSRSHSGQCRTPSTSDGCRRPHTCGHLNRNRQLILASSSQLIALASIVREASFVTRNPPVAMQDSEFPTQNSYLIIQNSSRLPSLIHPYP